MSTARTFFFKDIFPDYPAFSRFLAGAGLDAVTSTSFSERAYTWLFREYAISNINYDTPEMFCLDFAQLWEQYAKQAEIRADNIREAQSAPAGDWGIRGRVVNNIAVAPNSIVVNPTEPIGYVTQQNFAEEKSSSIDALMRRIDEIPSVWIRDFVARFKGLFVPYFEAAYYYYQEED